MNRNCRSGAARDRRGRMTTSCQLSVGSAGPRPGFRRIRDFMPRWPLAYGPLGLPGPAVGVMTLITRQCFAIPTSGRERRDRGPDEEGPTGPGRARERDTEEI